MRLVFHGARWAWTEYRRSPREVQWRAAPSLGGAESPSGTSRVAVCHLHGKLRPGCTATAVAGTCAQPRTLKRRQHLSGAFAWRTRSPVTSHSRPAADRPVPHNGAWCGGAQRVQLQGISSGSQLFFLSPARPSEADLLRAGSIAGFGLARTSRRFPAGSLPPFTTAGASHYRAWFGSWAVCSGARCCPVHEGRLRGHAGAALL